MPKFNLDTFLSAHGKPCTDTAGVSHTQRHADTLHSTDALADPEYSNTDMDVEMRLSDLGAESGEDLLSLTFDHLEEKLCTIRLPVKTAGCISKPNIVSESRGDDDIRKSSASGTQGHTTEDTISDDLDTRLLEGALKNLDYFPQLLKEVQHIKQEKDKQKRLNEEKRKTEQIEREREDKHREQERVRQIEKYRTHAVSQADRLLTQVQIENLQTKLDMIQSDTSDVRTLSTELQSKIYSYRHEINKWAELEDMMSSHKLTADSSKEIIDERLDVVNMYTSTGQADFIDMIGRTSSNQKQIDELREQVNQLRVEKDKLLTDKVGVINNKLSSPVASRNKQEVEKSIRELKNTRSRLVLSLTQYE